MVIANTETMSQEFWPPIQCLSKDVLRATNTLEPSCWPVVKEEYEGRCKKPCPMFCAQPSLSCHIV